MHRHNECAVVVGGQRWSYRPSSRVNRRRGEHACYGWPWWRRKATHTADRRLPAVRRRSSATTAWQRLSTTKACPKHRPTFCTRTKRTKRAPPSAIVACIIVPCSSSSTPQIDRLPAAPTASPHARRSMSASAQLRVPTLQSSHCSIAVNGRPEHSPPRPFPFNRISSPRFTHSLTPNRSPFPITYLLFHHTPKFKSGTVNGGLQMDHVPINDLSRCPLIQFFPLSAAVNALKCKSVTQEFGTLSGIEIVEAAGTNLK